MHRIEFTPITLLAISLLAAATHCHGQTNWDGDRLSLVSELIAAEQSADATLGKEKSDALQKDEDCEFVDTCCPRWITRVNAIFMQRSRPDQFILINSPVVPVPNLDARNFDFGFQTGVDASIMRTIGCNKAIEFRYFDLFESDAAQTVAIPVSSQINAIPITNVPGNRVVAATYDSELRTFEINGRVQPRDWLSLFAGFRYVRLDEHFNANLVDPAGLNLTARYDTVTSNNLYGAQIGGDAVIWDHCDRFQIEVLGKAGIYGNDASQRTVFGNGVFTRRPSGGRGQVSFLGEIGVTGAYRLTDCWSIRGGYQMMWISGVALATNQVPVTNLLTRTGFDGGGSIFFHGAFVGLELTLP